MSDCGNFALNQLGLPELDPQCYARFSGAGVEDYIFAVLEAAGDSEHLHRDAFWRHYLEKNESAQKDGNVPYEGIVSVLHELKKRGILLAVLSNKDEASCVPIVENLIGKDVFDLIRGGRPDFPSKPDPAGIDLILSSFALKKEECLYVGDTEVDMLTGKNAGVDTVAVLWGYRTKEDLALYQPQYFLDSPQQILRLFDEV
jgi:phosphoglycolate phosphatase